eukprot:TRINITY_DN5559_c2_g1_i1.p1 TRINITY_DN5559_c2_g1~~TRINITY_DN5559_c2_g1_i1.p1  ORF type:complete len:941 (-),score=276.22 TRINITY_DN5559_c2_g1_i1:70-2892(-)
MIPSFRSKKDKDKDKDKDEHKEEKKSRSPTLKKITSKRKKESPSGRDSDQSIQTPIINPNVKDIKKEPTVRIRSGGWSKGALNFDDQGPTEGKESPKEKKTSKSSLKKQSTESESPVSKRTETTTAWAKKRPITEIMKTVAQLRPLRCANCRVEQQFVKQVQCSACGFGWWTEDRGVPLCIVSRKVDFVPEKVFNHKLPDQILWKIFSFGDPKTLGTAACVSHQWNLASSSDPVWQPLCMTFGDRKLPSQYWKEVFLEMMLERQKQRDRLATARREQRNWKPTKFKFDQNIAAELEAGEEIDKQRPRPDFDTLQQKLQGVVMGKGNHLNGGGPGGGKWYVHPHSSNSATVELALPPIDFFKSVRELVKILQRVNDIHPSAIPGAINRYEKFLRLKIKYPHHVLIPTADIEFIWMNHLKRPLAYNTDIKRLVSEINGTKEFADDEQILVDHKILGSPLDMQIKRQALLNTIQLWSKEYNKEVYCTISSSEHDMEKKAPYFESLNNGMSRIVMEGSRAIYYDKIVDTSSEAEVPQGFTFNFTQEDIKKDQDWFGSVKTYLEKAKIRLSPELDVLTDDQLMKLYKAYERYLFFAAKYSPERIPPESNAPFLRFRSAPIDATPAIYLMWTAHLMYPKVYNHDCRKYLECHLLQHEPGKKSTNTKMRETWREEFGISITREHCYHEWDETEEDQEKVKAEIRKCKKIEREKEEEKERLRKEREKGALEAKKKVKNLVKNLVTKLDSDSEEESDDDDDTGRIRLEHKKKDEKPTEATPQPTTTEESTTATETSVAAVEPVKNEEVQEKKEPEPVKPKPVFSMAQLDSDSDTESSDEYSDEEEERRARQRRMMKKAEKKSKKQASAAENPAPAPVVTEEKPKEQPEPTPQPEPQAAATQPEPEPVKEPIKNSRASRRMTVRAAGPKKFAVLADSGSDSESDLEIDDY